MRYDKQELIALASQTSQNFDREGVLIMKERQDSFFRRSEGHAMRWCRLRGNLLFYLKGPESWTECMGVIVLGYHQVKVQNQDENGYWPFHIVWESGVCYRMATFHESERTLWLKAIDMAPYESISAQLASLKEKLNKIRPLIDIATYRMQKGIVIDMNEIPLCEWALSCDNLLCDAYGTPPSPLIVVHVKYPKGLCVRYGSTEIVDKCSNPSFSKTILFRASDGLAGDALVRLVVYDMKERVTETAVPMGFAALQLSTIQEAQRLRVAVMNKEKKTIGFVTINGWSLEPSYIGTSPSHSNDKNCIDIPQKLLCHRRSQSLPPRLGLKLKFPSYGNLLKQNFVNSHQVTYRFHSGLGGDITVHEIMAEPKMCYQIPIQLLDIYIEQEKELLEELFSVGEMCGEWQSRQLDLLTIHVVLLKHYCHSRRCMQHVETPYFKASSKKEESSLEFAPINLHLQRLWVHNDTLNKTGFHDVVTVGAFAAHTHKAERTGGLIRLVQQMKDINSTKTVAAGKIRAEFDNVVAVKRLKEETLHDMERIVVLLQARQWGDALGLIEGVRSKTKSLLSLWDPSAIEETLSAIDWPKRTCAQEDENQTISTIMHLTEQLSIFDAMNAEGDFYFDASSSFSSKDTSPTVDFPTLSSSFPNICPNGPNSLKPVDFKIFEGAELEFHNDYFKFERQDRLNHSFRSVRSAKFNEGQSLSFESQKKSSLKHDFKSSASLEQVSYRSLMDSLSGSDKKKNSEARRDSITLTSAVQLDPAIRLKNLEYLKGVGSSVDEMVNGLIDTVSRTAESKDTSEESIEDVKNNMNQVKSSQDELVRWLRISHTALRLRYESPALARDRTALQTRWDTCFSQALTAISTGLLCWLSSVPSDVIIKTLSSGLGPLCGFEGLLSLYSTEKAMWGDMVVAVEDLQTVVFTLTKVGHSNQSLPQVKGTRGALTVLIPVSDSLYNKFSNKEHLTFTITAVFFNIGINEKAALAEALGETKPQYHSNSDNLNRLNKYYYKYNKILHDHVAAARATSSRTKPLEEVMENLRIAVHKKVPKNTEVLHLAALATRLMNGIRFTSCKSAKDRTGMSVTLEQCSILATEYHLAEHEMRKALAIMRSEGCRRENTLKNIHLKKYAFTKILDLPEDYRPPPGAGTSTLEMVEHDYKKNVT